MRYPKVSTAALALAACAATACGSNIRVTTIQLGRSLNADSTIATHTTVFKPSETIYVSVVTAGVGSATIRAKWTYAGHVLSEPEKRMSSRDSAATEFHLQSGDGFPPGEYSVEIFLDGESVGSRAFRVEGG